MKSNRWRIFIVLCAFLAIAWAVGAGVYSEKLSRIKAQEQTKPRMTVTDTLPPVTSQIKGIEVVSSFIDADGMANITVVNKTGKTIIGLGFASGNITFTDDNGTQDNPKPLMAPYGSYTITQPISNLPANQSIRVSAVFYGDGTEDGDMVQRKHIHETREMEKERLRKAKEAKP